MEDSTLVPEVFLDFSLLEMREPRSGEKEKPLVNLDLNLTLCSRQGQDLTLGF